MLLDDGEKFNVLRASIQLEYVLPSSGKTQCSCLRDLEG